ncbi:MAG: membrane protein insertion efficiency factor YidD [Actinomycetota bacterium]
MNAIRRAAWIAGVPLRALLLGAIGLYRVTVSGRFGDRCKYHPTCSSYAAEAIRTHGALKGSLLGAWRLLRCNPFSDGGFDRVPTRGGRGMYEHVIHHRRAPRVTG